MARRLSKPRVLRSSLFSALEIGSRCVQRNEYFGAARAPDLEVEDLVG